MLAHNNRWLILAVVVLICLPVMIDATVLHVAAPTLSLALEASGSELLWIIDIYSLTMAGLLLPMGALSDRIGFKRLAMLGSVLFGVASLAAALAPTAAVLIAARAALAVGAAMLLPATLAALRQTFHDEGERSIALGVWSAVGTGGAAIGPLVGGFLLEHFYWGSVFLINLPIVAVVLVATALTVPKQEMRPGQPWNVGQALVLIAAILLLIYAAKSGLRGGSSPWVTTGVALAGAGLLWTFVRHQLRAAVPMIDLQLLAKRPIAVGVAMALAAMIALVGFELLMAQELQFVHGKTPLEAGMFMLPMMIAAGVSGPIAGWLVAILGLRLVATAGMALSAVSLFALAGMNMVATPLISGIWIVLLGFSVATALLASTAAIMSATPSEKAGAAGSIESMAYELGSGLGVAVFGVMLASIYAAHVSVPAGLSPALASQAAASIGEAMQVAREIDGTAGQALIGSARTAFSTAHGLVLRIAGGIFAGLTVLVWFAMPPPGRVTPTH